MATRRRLPRLVMPVEPASSAEALAFIRSLQEIRNANPKDYEQRVTDIVRDTKLGTLQGIARRVMMDLAKGPPNPGEGVRKEPNRRRVSAKKKAATRKSPPRGTGPR